jgi:ribA/ribD-fused uncharacterized protein
MEPHFHLDPERRKDIFGNEIVDQFRGEHFFLSNFYPATVLLAGINFQTTEHAFQWFKTLDPTERELVRTATTPGRAKAMGGQVTQRADWDSIRINVMYQINRAKFTQHPDLQAKLLMTGDSVLIEGNSWGDTFWGVCKGKGENWLGKILMQIREELRNNTAVPVVV